MEIDPPEEWICLKGSKEYQYIRGYPPEANVLPCAKCKDRLEEAEDYERVKGNFAREKEAMHVNQYFIFY